MTGWFEEECSHPTHMVFGASLRLQPCAAEAGAAARACAQEGSIAAVPAVGSLLDDALCSSSKLPAQPKQAVQSH